MDGFDEGCADGDEVGTSEGNWLGLADGDKLGEADGDPDGAALGSVVGYVDGDADGVDDGNELGASDGSSVGALVGNTGKHCLLPSSSFVNQQHFAISQLSVHVFSEKQIVVYISQPQLSSLILPSRTQAENRQYIFCVDLNCSSGIQPRKPSALQVESISETHSSGFPYASSIHLHDDASQPSEHNSGRIFYVSESAGVKFSAARARAQCPDKMTVAASNFFMSWMNMLYFSLAPALHLVMLMLFYVIDL